MNNSPSDGGQGQAKGRKRGIATAKTSGLAQSALERLREKRRKLKEQDPATREKAREQRMKIFDALDAPYYSEGDMDSTSEDEWVEFNEAPPPTKRIVDKPKNSSLKEDKKKPRYDYDDLFTMKLVPEDANQGTEATKKQQDYDDLFTLKDAGNAGTAADQEPPAKQKDYDDLFIKNKGESDTDQETPSKQQDYDNLFTKKDEDRQKVQLPDTLYLDNVPTRRILYRARDPRSRGPDAILQCKICLKEGEMYLFSTEEKLKSHLDEKHDLGWITRIL